MLQPTEVQNAEVSEISYTKIETFTENTVNSPEELFYHSQPNNELPTIPSQSSFQPKPNNQ